STCTTRRRARSSAAPCAPSATAASASRSPWIWRRTCCATIPPGRGRRSSPSSATAASAGSSCRVRCRSISFTGPLGWTRRECSNFGRMSTGGIDRCWRRWRRRIDYANRRTALFADLVDALRTMARGMAFAHELLSSAPDDIDLLPMPGVQNVSQSPFQVARRDRDVVDPRLKAEAGQVLLYCGIGHQEGAGGRDLEVLGHRIAESQAVRESREVL